jgi:hypothetical protein
VNEKLTACGMLIREHEVYRTEQDAIVQDQARQMAELEAELARCRAEAEKAAREVHEAQEAERNLLAILQRPRGL